MKLELYDNITKFAGDVMDSLMKHEIQNNLIISNCFRGIEGWDTSSWLMGVVKDSMGVPMLIALMTPPHNLVIYEVDNYPANDALELLVKEIYSLDSPMSGVLAEKSLAIRFADMYAGISGKVKDDGMSMSIYRLDRVNDIPEASGRLRLANLHDLYFLPYWSMGFNLDCGLQGGDVLGAIEKAKWLINNENLFIWEDDCPVSQAAMGRRTPNGAVVNAVYTPPHYRGKGYATSCVAGLSRHLLGNGYKFCSLFTNLANPISNSIYMKIGYKAVCDYNDYKFSDEREV